MCLQPQYAGHHRSQCPAESEIGPRGTARSNLSCLAAFAGVLHGRLPFSSMNSITGRHRSCHSPARKFECVEAFAIEHRQAHVVVFWYCFKDEFKDEMPHQNYL